MKKFPSSSPSRNRLARFANRFATPFAKDTGGLAAVEFALIAPIMLTLFLGVLEASDALSASRRTVLAVNTLTDLAAQETELDNDDITDLFIGVSKIIDQRDIEVTFRLASVSRDPDTDEIVVDWSRDSNNGTPYAPDSAFDNLSDPTLVDSSSSIIVGEVVYTYESALTNRIIGQLTFEKQATRWPRRTSTVDYCGASC